MWGVSTELGIGEMKCVGGGSGGEDRAREEMEVKEAWWIKVDEC